MPDAPAPKSAEEFFYLDKAGTKQDAELHNAILNPVDYPIDEKVMNPIRERNRAKWLAEQRAAQNEARRKSQWKRAKARAVALLGKFDPSQPRDNDGKWSGGGGSESEGGGGGAVSQSGGVPGYSPGVKGRGRVEVDARLNEWVKASPVKTISDIIRAAPIAQKALGSAGNKIAADLGITFKDPGPKTSSPKGIARTEEKIALRGGAANVTDATRGAFILTKPEQADDIIHKLAETHEVVAEPWRMIPQSHYVDRALLVRDRQTGLVGEVQMMDQKMWDAKSIGHKLYEEARALPKDDPRLPDFERRMKAVYDPVLDSYKGTSWEAIDSRARS